MLYSCRTILSDLEVKIKSFARLFAGMQKEVEYDNWHYLNRLFARERKRSYLKLTAKKNLTIKEMAQTKIPIKKIVTRDKYARKKMIWERLQISRKIEEKGTAY